MAKIPDSKNISVYIQTYILKQNKALLLEQFSYKAKWAIFFPCFWTKGHLHTQQKSDTVSRLSGKAHMPKQHFLFHNKTILVCYRRSPNADTSKDLKLILCLKILVSNTVGMHFNISGPYKLNDVKQQIIIIQLGEAGNCRVNAMQICFSNHILKFAWYETPAPKWCCILKAQDNNKSLGMSNSHSEKPRKQARCWIFPVWEAAAATGLAAFLCSAPHQ